MDTDNKPVPVLSGYKNVSKTFTYAITYAALPLFFFYQIGTSILSEGKIVWEINGVDSIFQRTVALFGILPNEAGLPLSLLFLAFGSMLVIYHERKKYGYIDVRGSYLFITIKDAFLISLLVNPIAAFFAHGDLLIPFTKGFSIPSSFHEFLPQITHAAGAGFYEELFFRVIVLGLVICLLRYITKLSLGSKFIGVLITAIVFSAVHFTGPMAYEYTLWRVIYLFCIGVMYGTLYLKRGLAVTAWTHTFANLLVSSGIF